MVTLQNRLGRFLIKNKEDISSIVILFLALLTFFSIMGISFKDTGDQSVYLKKKLVVETFDDDHDYKEELHKFKKHIKKNSGDDENYNKAYDHPSKMDCEKDPSTCHEHCTEQERREDCIKHSHCGWSHSYHHHHKAFIGQCHAHDITTKALCEQPNFTSQDNELCYYERGDHVNKKKSCYPDKNHCKKFAEQHNVDHNDPHHISDPRHINYENHQKINEDGDETS